MGHQPQSTGEYDSAPHLGWFIGCLAALIAFGYATQGVAGGAVMVMIVVAISVI